MQPKGWLEICDLAVVDVASGGQSFFRLGADAEVGMGFCVDDFSVFRNHVSRGNGSRQLLSPLTKGMLTRMER